MNNSNLTIEERERERRPLTLVKLKGVYGQWLFCYKNLPRIERMGIGQKIERALLDALELIFIASFTPPAGKIPLLAKAISRLDIAKFFLQLIWENKLLTNKNYTELTLGLEEVGRMLYGWKKGIESKTPVKTGEIR